MPPKKGATKAKTPVKAAAASTITNAKGKEVDATAAAARPKRAVKPVELLADEPTVKKAPAKKAATKAAPKAAPKAATTTAANTGKKRGRPAKEDAEDVAEPPKKKGKTVAATKPAKKAGRPAKGSAPAVASKATAPPKKRGRPPKGGETTKIEADEEAAAEQLEEELVEAVEDGKMEEEPSKRKSPAKRGRPPKAKGRGKKAATNGDVVMDDAGEDGETSVKQYWLMKAEQEDREETLKDGSVFNAKFTIDDLREKEGPEPWDGVRNPTANKNMKDMKLGDLAFFYASGGKKPGVSGIMEVVKEWEADPGAWDENSPYYVENAKMRGSAEKPRWGMVHVEFRKKLSTPVFLSELKKYSESDSVLQSMQMLTTARLSVSKVTEEEWNFIVNNLIEGYDDDADNNLPTLPNGPNPKGDLPNGAAVALDGSAESEMPNGSTVVISKEIPDSDAATTNTALAADTAATSSRPASRAGSKKPGSRAGSLVPPTAATRGRSRTPRAGSAQPMGAVAEETEEFAMA